MIELHKIRETNLTILKLIEWKPNVFGVKHEAKAVADLPADCFFWICLTFLMAWT